MPRICDLKYALCLVFLLAGCSGELKGEADGLTFVRCSQTKVAERTHRVGALTLRVQGRVLQVDGAQGIAAFTGPVGRAFTSEDVAQLSEHELALWLGGLGDTLELAQANLARIAARRIPTLFIAGGADRWPIVDKAFEALPEDVPIVQGSGLRVLKLGPQDFVIAAGAPFGRYAIDEQACGLTRGDLLAIPNEVGELRGATMLSWHAPNGESHELGAAWRGFGEKPGLSAFPEPAGPARDLYGWTVPRLGAPGTQRADGARLKSGVGHFVLGAGGLVPRP